MNFDLSVSLLLTFLVISDNENCLRFATARKCKHLLLQKKRRQRWEGLASLNISPSLESPPPWALPTHAFLTLTEVKDSATLVL